MYVCIHVYVQLHGSEACSFANVYNVYVICDIYDICVIYVIYVTRRRRQMKVSEDEVKIK